LTFKKAMRGYDPKQVDEYIGMLREGYLEMERGYKELEGEKAQLEQELEKEREQVTELMKYQQDAAAIAHALIDAESMAKQIVDHARLKADETLLLAKNESTRLLGEAKREMAQLEMGKRNIEQQLRALVAAFEGGVLRREERASL
jgi:cell division initiation protein